MPNFDHTGPNGEGSRSGRGMGKCGGAGRKAAQTGATITTSEQETAQGMAPAWGGGDGACRTYGQDAAPGCCGRRGQGNGGGRNRAMNRMRAGNGAGMATGNGAGQRGAQGMGQRMSQGGSAAGQGCQPRTPDSDVTDNNR
ncbi:hypothetical protein DDIC_12060 [Desulfovibrio desulfuricans]|uniref:Uncharacterized protein n=1 Tax=Desulfovibrio desulfuricans TaxID=876 RepID=A0A4P7ULB9_DESDE|nr:DUF5320 family protein [Desulfovibrio desulfuricans]QCC86597.1 hypothetical protein DDIC_12060 [Desulfovibrio desulfuricans]